MVTSVSSYCIFNYLLSQSISPVLLLLPQTVALSH